MFNLTELSLHIQDIQNIQDIIDNQQSFTTRWTAQEGLPYFRGHFPGQPILPAVAMIDISTEILRRALRQTHLYIRTIKSGKFTHPVTPHLSVEILLKAQLGLNWQAHWTTQTESSQAPTPLAIISFSIESFLADRA